MFGFDNFHISLAGLGLAILIAYWLPRFVSGREPAASALLILLGFSAFLAFPDISKSLDPVEHPKYWEVASELCVIIGLFGTGLRIDRLATGAPGANCPLLLIAMPLCIGALAIFGWAVAGLTLAGAAAGSYPCADRPGVGRRRPGRAASEGGRASRCATR
jgi:hypothetical protein